MNDAPFLLTSVGALTNLLFAGAIGGMVCGSWLPAETAYRRCLNRVLGACLLLLALAHGGYLWLQAAAMGDVPLTAAGPLLWTVLSESHYGRIWLIGSAGLALAAAAGASPLSQRQYTQRGVMALGLALYACGRVGASHAADSGDFSVAEGVHWLHLCATGVWAGGVLISSFTVLSHKGSRIPDKTVQAFCQRLSQVATWVFVLVLASGLYNIRHIAAQNEMTGAFTSSRYGHLFGVKALLILGVILLAGINREWVLPSLLRAPPPPRASPPTICHPAADRGVADVAYPFDRRLARTQLALGVMFYSRISNRADTAYWLVTLNVPAGHLLPHLELPHHPLVFMLQDMAVKHAHPR